MKPHEIIIEWEGPFTTDEVINKKNDGGKSPDWDGEDYGLYQIYGRHLLYGYDALLYMGQCTDQTFSQRIDQEYRDYLKDEKDIQLFLGRIYDYKRHSRNDNWQNWKWDIDMAESILIYKYSPIYNIQKTSNPPVLEPYKNIILINNGSKYRLEKEDKAPEDFSW